MKRRFVSCLAVVMLMLMTGGTSWAQQVSGTQISGVVKDSSGGVLPGVEVTVKKTDTGMIRTVFTGGDGSYTIPNLPVGPYELKAVLSGFNTYVKTGIVLQVNTNPTIDVTLGVGAIGETVTVTADAQTVETKSTGVGQVINNQTVVEMPLNGRQATELIFLSGLSTPASAGDLNTNKNYPTVTISVAGGQANGMTYIMDGGTHNDPFNNLNLPTLFPDALQEFKVESSALPARYGHHAASAVNIVTKSGTNVVKGNVFEFLRDYHFNARNAFATTRDSLKRNQFGGTIGAPIKKDKVFVFGAYQGKIEKSNPPDLDQLRADGGDAGGRLHGVHVAGVQRGPPDRVEGAVLGEQHDRPQDVQPGGAEFPQVRAGVHRPLRKAAVRHSQRQHRASDADEG